MDADVRCDGDLAGVEWSESDQYYGYQFGCDGLLTVREVEDLLRVSRSTIWRMCADGTLRKGRDEARRKVRICRRSVSEYIKSLEE
ncbi:MAG: helix-turn-helix transcriptional regulator [Maioricimonas sp. JB049]